MAARYKTSQVYIAMICAFFVGSIASTVLAAAPDGDGMTLDQYEWLFGLDLTHPDNAILDYDGDGLSNLKESFRLTDPFSADTDDDGWPDAVDNAISRARLDFHPLFTDGDFFRYTWPTWMVAAFKAGGAWETSLPAWYVPAGTSGTLCLNVDRAVLANDVVLELEFYDAPNASLFVDLVNGNKEVLISSELLGNLVDGSGEIVRKAMNISLESYPEAVGIHLRGTGELFVFEGLLYVDLDNDGLDADQEAILGTSDLMFDSDGDGINDYQEVFVYGTNPAVPDPVSSGDKAVQEGVAQPSDSSLDPVAGGINSQTFRATRIKATPIPQWVQARLAVGQSWMSGPNFMVNRSVLGGGGTRQSGGALILEDTVAQPSAIGFSSDTDFVLHAGYQQAEEEELLEIRNVSVTPRPYNEVNRQFNPNWGETSTFSYVISTPAQMVTMKVWSEQNTNTPVITCLASNINAGLHTLQWNGRDASGALVAADVYYRFTISATDAKGRVVSYEPIGSQTNEIRIEVVDNIPVISWVSDAPDPFSPPAQTNVMTYNISSPGNNHQVTVTYEDSQPNVVSAFTNSGQGPGAYLVEWGGTNSAGANMPDGIYVYRVNVVRAGKEGNEKTGAVILLRENETNTVVGDVKIWHRTNEVFTIEEIPSAGLGGAAIGIVADDLEAQSPVYNIINEGPNRTADEPPFILIFQYDQAITGNIEEKLQVRRYDTGERRWRPLEPANQFIDYVNHQVIVEVWELSLLGLFTGKDTSPPLITILSPQPKSYPGETEIDILYEVEDPSGVMSAMVYLNGVEYPYETIAPADLLAGENVLTVKASDKVGNIRWVGVRFRVGLLDALVRLEPETLNVNPGVLTAFVKLLEGYDPVHITDATCDGAACESMQVNGDGTEMIIKFRRKDIEKALAETGEKIDTFFIVRGTYTDETGTLVFEGTDEISKIVGE